MSGLLTATTLGTALACGVAGGVFFAFSVFVTRALGDLPPEKGLAAMQSVNRAAVTPLFMTLLFGAAVACVALVVVSLRQWGEPFAWRLMAGSVIYLGGVIVMTIAFHVPRNDSLAGLTPGAPGAADAWETYLSDWTAGNHVRAVAGILATGLLMDAIRVGAAG